MMSILMFRLLCNHIAGVIDEMDDGIIDQQSNECKTSISLTLLDHSSKLSSILVELEGLTLKRCSKNALHQSFSICSIFDRNTDKCNLFLKV